MRKLRKLTYDQELEVFNERESDNRRNDIISKWGISERHYKNIILKFGGELKKIPTWCNFNID